MKRIALDAGLDPYALFAASRDDHPHAFILESLTGPARLAEHTFVGFDPEIIISYRSGVMRSNGETVKTDRPLEALRSILAKYAAPGVPGGTSAGWLVTNRRRSTPKSISKTRSQTLRSRSSS